MSNRLAINRLQSSLRVNRHRPIAKAILSPYLCSDITYQCHCKPTTRKKCGGVVMPAMGA